jgi:Cu/Ag efflux protein CusF
MSTAMAALMIGPVTAFAHNGIEHVLGTVTAVSSASITVETLKHTSVTVMVDGKTIFTHKDEKASLKELKAGERVAINAKETAAKALVALTVKWGAASASASNHEEKTWSGQISDGMCGADHSAMAEAGKPVVAHDCTLVCVKGGSKFVFVSGGKVYNIANQGFGELAKLAGRNVALSGELGSDGKTLSVSKLIAQ